MHRYIRTSARLTLLLLAGAACATASSTPSGRSPDKITRAEIDATSASSAYDVVTRLHPNWLNPPASALTGVMSTAQSGTTNVRVPLVLVYLDGVRLGATDQLRTISASIVQSMEFMSATRAATVLRDLGSASPDAVIMVSTK